ncbi:MAG TPA: hypothetical protein VFS43_31960 [Polyangiaceae bacterium]|nr:hypothetical protein [Polyangiaceae bacterium]
MQGERRFYAAVTGLYALTRLALFLLGVRFSVSYRWQHIHDIDLLRDRLGETLFYTHAFTPFLSGLIGVVHKVSERHAAAIYQALFFAFGAAFALSIAYLLRALRLGPRLAAAVVTFFCCTPPFIYMESFLHYEFPAAALLALAAALFHRALATGRRGLWLLFFADCALLAYVRTTFHLVWVLAAFALALLFRRGGRRAVLAAAAGPVLVVLALYLKNLALFGFFGTSSWFGFNVSMVTVRRMSQRDQRAWLAQGKLHPASTVKLYNGPRSYAAHVDLSKTRGVPVLDRLERDGGLPNYNHWSYIEISKIRMADGRRYIAERPGAYAREVLSNLVDYFRPTTRWHPLDRQSSPHLDNRQALEPWEDAYNNALHGGWTRPFGFYIPVLLLFAYGAGAAANALRKSRLEGCLEEKVVLFMAFCCLYVPALSCLVTTTELERYRFLVEAFLWAIGLWAGRRALERVPWALAAAALRARAAGVTRKLRTPSFARRSGRGG